MIEDIESIIESLARKMADAIVVSLTEAKVEQPLAVLSMIYRKVSNYVPNLEPMTLADMEDAIQSWGEELNWELLFLPNGSGIKVKKQGMEVLLNQLTQEMDSAANYKLGTSMLRRAAFLLTTGRLNGKIEVSEDFVAYAIDWEGEGHAFEQILRDCGQKEDVIMEWKKKGWLYPTE
jgi:hypothetical protein